MEPTITQRLEACLRHTFGDELGDTGGAYVLYTSDVDSPEVVAQDVYASAPQNADLLCRSAIGSRWMGRGVAVVLDDRALIAEYADDFPEMEAQTYESFVHAMAHVACQGIVVGTDDYAGIFSRQSASENTAGEDGEAPAGDTFGSHDVTFYRSLIHCIARAHDAGIDVDADAMFEELGLGPVHEYYQALKDELHACRGHSLTAILKTPVPLRFRVLFDEIGEPCGRQEALSN